MNNINKISQERTKFIGDKKQYLSIKKNAMKIHDILHHLRK
jgi:hypothetical protein